LIDTCRAQLEIATLGGSAVGHLDDIDDPVAEVLDLLDPHPVFSETPEPVLEEPAYRLGTRVDAQIPSRSVPDGIWAHQANDPVKVAAVQMGVHGACKLDRVVGRDSSAIRRPVGSFHQPGSYLWLGLVDLRPVPPPAPTPDVSLDGDGIVTPLDLGNRMQDAKSDLNQFLH
jgi:hypothetical protein